MFCRLCDFQKQNSEIAWKLIRSKTLEMFQPCTNFLIGEINSVFTTGISAPFSGIFLVVVKLLTTY